MVSQAHVHEAQPDKTESYFYGRDACDGHVKKTGTSHVMRVEASGKSVNVTDKHKFSASGSEFAELAAMQMDGSTTTVKMSLGDTDPVASASILYKNEKERKRKVEAVYALFSVTRILFDVEGFIMPSEVDESIAMAGLPKLLHHSAVSLSSVHASTAGWITTLGQYPNDSAYAARPFWKGWGAYLMLSSGKAKVTLERMGFVPEKVYKASMEVYVHTLSESLVVPVRSAVEARNALAAFGPMRYFALAHHMPTSVFDGELTYGPFSNAVNSLEKQLATLQVIPLVENASRSDWLHKFHPTSGTSPLGENTGGDRAALKTVILENVPPPNWNPPEARKLPAPCTEVLSVVLKDVQRGGPCVTKFGDEWFELACPDEPNSKVIRTPDGQLTSGGGQLQWPLDHSKAETRPERVWLKLPYQSRMTRIMSSASVRQVQVQIHHDCFSGRTLVVTSGGIHKTFEELAGGRNFGIDTFNGVVPALVMKKGEERLYKIELDNFEKGCDATAKQKFRLADGTHSTAEDMFHKFMDGHSISLAYMLDYSGGYSRDPYGSIQVKNMTRQMTAEPIYSIQTAKEVEVRVGGVVSLTDVGDPGAFATSKQIEYGASNASAPKVQVDLKEPSPCVHRAPIHGKASSVLLAARLSSLTTIYIHKHTVRLLIQVVVMGGYTLACSHQGGNHHRYRHTPSSPPPPVLLPLCLR